MFTRKLKAILRLIRPELPAAAGICVVFGQVIASDGFPRIWTILPGFLLGFFLSSSAMIFNDYFDLEVDRVNAPQRPIPSGQITPAGAVTCGLIAAIVALGIALALGLPVFGLCVFAWMIGFLYNWKLKSAGLAGNLIVSANVALTFLIGGVSVGQIGNPLIWAFAAIAGTFDLAEEIAGDAMDMAGDRERGSKSLAIVHGRDVALRISAVLFGVVILLSLVPVLLGETGPAYWIPILLMDALIVFFTTRLVKSRVRAEGHAWMRRLYLSATLGLLAFLLARFL